MNVFIKRALYMGKFIRLLQKIHTGKFNKSQKIRITKNKHEISSTKAYKSDQWISEPSFTEKLLHLMVNLGFIISWKKKIS